MPLEDSEWVAVKSMILKSDSQNKLDQLEELGATAIIVTEIQNCRVA
jgi:ATP phosphoribosyltransferase